MQSNRFRQHIIAPSRQAAFGPPSAPHREHLKTPASAAFRGSNNAQADFFHQRSQSLNAYDAEQSFIKASKNASPIDKFRMPTINRGPQNRPNIDGSNNLAALLVHDPAD
jgi:hypothetical protein